MNFATVNQCKGRMDGQYAAKTPICATFIEIGGQTFTTNQKPTVKVKLADDQGVSHTVHLYGNTLPNANMLNQRSCFDLSAFDGQGQGGPYVGYQGFWNNNAQTNQQPQGQQPQQPAPQSRQPTNAPAVDPTRLSIERQTSWKVAGTVVAERKYMNLAELIGDMVKLAAAGAKFMADGKDIPMMERQPGEDGPPPPGDDDYPWDN